MRFAPLLRRHGFAIATIAALAATGAVATHAQTISSGISHVVKPFLSCSSSTPCLEWTNTGSGTAIKGFGAHGNGVVGNTTFKSTPQYSHAGVYGSDSSGSSTYNSGVYGTSLMGTGVTGVSGTFIGVQASGWIGANINGGALASSYQTPALSVVGTNNGGTVAIDVCAPASNAPYCFSNSSTKIMELEDSGALFITGQIYTGGSCSIGCIAPHNKPIAHVVSYTPNVSQPTMEDYGESRLTDGRGYVRLDPAFANVIDQRAGYLVFITPEGPSAGLYVNDKTLSGFYVRENPGGHATIAFQYRIVATPYGRNGPRLPKVSVGTETRFMK